MKLTEPVVPEFVLIRHPFWLLVTTEFENVTRSTVLSLLPPMEPILKPWPPVQVMPVTRIFCPLVTATQSSWLLTDVFSRMRLLVDEISNPSELWAAGNPPLAELGALPAELSRVMPVSKMVSPPVISKQCTG